MKTNNTRRYFIKHNSLTGLSMLLAGNMDKVFNENISESISARADANETLEMASAKHLRDWYRDELFNRFLPNMDKSVVDHKYGGFMCAVDIRTGEVLKTTKRTWFEGRGIWMYSFLYNNLEKKPVYLEIARRSKDFIMKHQPTDKNFWTSSYTREGVSLSEPGDIFCDLYVAEGLVEYSKASGEKQFLAIGKKIVFNCLDKYDQPNYSYSLAAEIAGPRLLNHWMMFLRISSQMLEQEVDPEVEKLAERCINAILNYHLNPEFNLFNEVLSHDSMLIYNGRFDTFVNFGTGIQALWMLMFEGARKKDEKLLNQTKDLFKRHVIVAHDAIYGGYFWSLNNVDKYSFNLAKILSLQEEILIGSMFLMVHNEDLWSKKCFSETLTFVRKKFAFPKYKFWTEHGDRQVNNYQTNHVGIYHHPRHLMFNLLALERIMK